MNRLNFRYLGLSLALAAAAAWLALRPQAPAGENFSGATMGTTYAISLRECPAADCAGLAADISRLLNQLEGLFSHYDPDSQVTAFNNFGESDWFPVDEELLRVIAFAQSVSWQSEGAFDITAGPLINAWGFGPENTRTPPGETRIRELQRHVGYDKLSLRMDPPALAKQDPALTINLSAVAKGYAVDQLALLLESRGLTDYLVEIGGEVRTSGARPRGAPWRVGIEPPEAGLGIKFIVTPRDAAVATSGDYRNFFELNGRRYSHTIDPRTGAPVAHALASVSVIQPSTAQADALATALMVMGPETGLAFAEANDIPALFWLRTDAGVQAVSTAGFDAYLLKD